MGISPLFWGPMSQVYGRRIVSALLISVLIGYIVALSIAVLARAETAQNMTSF